MVTLRSQLIEPGVYAQFQSSEQFVSLPGGLRVLALVGKGKTTSTVSNESVTKGSLNGTDNLAFTAVSLPTTIVDQNFVSYNTGIDYQLTSGDVDWSLANAAVTTGTVAATSFNVTGLTLKVYLNNILQTVTFTGTNPISLSAVGGVLDQINAAYTNITASAVANKLRLTTTGTNNTTLRIGDGTSNSFFGLIGGLTSTSSREPVVGVKYNLSYERDKVSADYTPKLFFDLASVVREYGAVSTSNSLSLASSLAFQNGASVVMGIQVNPADTPDLYGFSQAIDKLAPVNINVLVVLNPDTNLHPIIKAHILASSTLLEQKFRTALIGLDGTPSVTDVQSFATGLSSRRVALVYPTAATVQLAGQTSTTAVDGTYIAAAIGAIRTNPAFDVAEPLLRKELVGFVSITDTLLRSQKNALANSGVMIVESQNNTIRVRDGLTTDVSTADSAEYSVTEIIDFVSNTTRQFLEAAFIATKLLNETPGLIHASLTIILGALVDNKILTDFSDISVVRNNLDPTQIDITFKIAPVFPVKYILVTFTI